MTRLPFLRTARRAPNIPYRAPPVGPDRVYPHGNFVRSIPKPYFVAGLLALALALPPRPSVVSALTGEPLAGVVLHLPVAYVLLAPLCGVFDYLTVLTPAQHAAVLGTLLAFFLGWRLLRRRRRRGPLRRAAIEIGAALGFLAAVFGFYAFGILGPHPMARLVVDDPDVVVVDFHSHTLSSHDGRKTFTAERNRAWHRGAGYDVAYITDHDSIRAAIEAERHNPARAGDGTVILPGREVVYAGQHVAVLGPVDPRLGPAAGTGGVPDPATPCAGWPVLIQTIPNNLGNLPAAECTEKGAGVRAIELVDGDPRGLAQGERERARILHLADSLDIAVVAVTNLHGWGRTAPGWSLVTVPGWRAMSPEEVGARIEDALRHGGRDAVQVVSVRRPSRPLVGVGVAALPVVTLADFVARRSRAERLSWLAWIALAVVFGRAWRRSRRSRPA